MNVNSITETNQEKIQTRRMFIKNTLIGAGYVLLGTYASSLLSSCSTESNPTSPQNGGNNGTSEIALDITKQEYNALSKIGGTVALPGNSLDGNGILVIRSSQNSVDAFSRTCTHQGCTVSNFQNGVSTCPCHGSQFNTGGNVVKGPATQPLKKYNATISGNIITIKP